jgi:hypothetical protein
VPTVLNCTTQLEPETVIGTLVALTVTPALVTVKEQLLPASVRIAACATGD